MTSIPETLILTPAQLARAERNARILDAYRRRVPINDLAREFTLSPWTVMGILQTLGEKPRSVRSCQTRRRNDAIVAAVTSGRTMTEVAAEQGLSRERVSQICWNAGLSLKSLCDRHADAVRQIWNEGEPVEIIANRCGITVGMVRRIVRDLGLHRPKPQNRLGSKSMRAVVGILSGKPYDAIAEESGLCRQGVANLASCLRKHGVQVVRRTLDGASRRVPASTFQVLANLLDGKSPCDISAQLGMSITTVHYIRGRARRAGIRIPDRRRQTA